MRRFVLCLSSIFVLVLLGLFGINDSNVLFAQSTNLSISPLTWNVVGLDSNNPTEGPQYFPVGAEVCNTSGSPLTNVVVDFVWDDAVSTSPYIDVRAGTRSSVTITTLANGECRDVYFEIEIDQVAAAYDDTRGYYIQVSSGSEVVTTPQPAEIYVEYLISQNRNSTDNVSYALEGNPLVDVPAGGEMYLVVGETYIIELESSTATQGYEQLEAFIAMPNTIFQLNSVETTYSANTSSGNVSSPNPSMYADACKWENDPNSPNYRTCLQSSLKAGGSLTTTYNVTIISGGGTSQTLNTLIYDFSGSSYHYNTDFSSGYRIAVIIDPTTADIAKEFVPSTITNDGVSTLKITLSNPNGGILSDYNFVDNLPTGMTVATPPNASTNGCGNPTFAPTAGDTSLSFADGTVAANSTCTIAVDVTASIGAAPPTNYVNTTNNLFIGTNDTGHNATATLTVSDSPALPACTPNISVATWTFESGTTNPSYTSTSVSNATATYSTTNNTVVANPNSDVVNNSTLVWEGIGFIEATGPDPDTGPGANDGTWFEFTLDTSNLTGGPLTIDLQTLPYPNGDWAANGNITINVHASTDGGTTFNTIGNFPVTKGDWLQLPTSTVNSPGASTTIFRINASGVKANSTTTPLYVDNVNFIGCAVPEPPTLEKAFSPNPIGAGDTSTLTFMLTNPNTTVALTGASFSDNLPAGVTVANPANASTTCAGGAWSPVVGSSSLNFSGGTIPAGDSCTLQVDVTSSTAEPYTNISGFISTTETGENNSADGSAAATLIVLAPPEISKLFSPNPILANGVSTLSFTIVNPNQNNDINGVAFSDSFPANMVVANAPNVSSDCGGTVTAAAAASTISLSGGSIQAGGNCSISIDVTVSSIGNYANTSGNVSHLVNGTVFDGNTTSDTLEVVAPDPGISILKQVATSPTGPWFDYVAVEAGTDVYYQLIVENIGDVPLSAIDVNDPDIDTSDCTWNVPLPVADTTDDDHINICVVGPITTVAGTNINTATASATYSSNPVSNNADSATYADAELTLVKAANPVTFTTAGDVINYTFTVINSGAAILSGPVTIDDDQAIDESCPALSTIGDFDDFFDPGEQLICTASYTITNTDVANGSVTNTATATSGGIQSNTDVETATLPGAAEADLSLVKDINNSTPNIGDSITFTITISNAGPGDATNVSVSDQLPAGYSYVSDNPSQGSYISGTGVWTVGTILIGSSASLTLTATVNSAGPYTNVAEITAVDQTDPDSIPNNDDGDQSEDDEDNQTVIPVDTPAIDATKADSLLIDNNGNGLVDAGDRLLYTILITNSGSTDAANVEFSDTPDANTSLIMGSVTSTQGTITSGNTGGDTTISVDIGNMLSGSTVTLTFYVIVDSPLSDHVTSIANQGVISGSNVPNTLTDDPDTPTDDDQTITAIHQSATKEPDLIVELFDPALNKSGFILPGELGFKDEQIKWFFTVVNRGAAAGYDIVVTDVLRPELRVDSLDVPSPMIGTINDQIITVKIPSLAAGESVNFSIVTTVIESSEEIDNTACLTASNYDQAVCDLGQVVSILPDTGGAPYIGRTSRWHTWFEAVLIVSGAIFLIVQILNATKGAANRNDG